MQRACLCYYVIITYYYVIITLGSIITHYYLFQSPELADALPAFPDSHRTAGWGPGGGQATAAGRTVPGVPEIFRCRDLGSFQARNGRLACARPPGPPTAQPVGRVSKLMMR